MHACGHDTHMTTWVGTARRLAAMRSQWSGTLVMIAQPGEEIGAGAKAMLDDGLFTRFPQARPMPRLPRFGEPARGHDRRSTRGYALANVDTVDIDVHGVGGHGAYPHTTRDPIVLASRIVTDAADAGQPRERTRSTAAVVTVGSFHSGTKHNIISDEARLQLTVRSFTPEVRQQLLDGIARIARGEAIAAGMPEDRMPVVTVREAEFTPATVNTERLADAPADLFRAHFGDGRVVETQADHGRRGFQPLLACRPVHREPDLLGRRRAPGALGRRPWRHVEAAVAAQPVLGARRRSGDLDRDRGDDASPRSTSSRRLRPAPSPRSRH